MFHINKVCENYITGEDHFNVDILVPTSEYNEYNSKWFTLMKEAEETVLESKNLDYDATVSLLKPLKKTLCLKFKLNRKITRSVLQHITTWHSCLSFMGK